MQSKYSFSLGITLFLLWGVLPIAQADDAGFTILQLNDVYQVEGIEGGSVTTTTTWLRLP